jgi:hypothetical protein
MNELPTTPPTTDAFTPYDQAHFALYLGVLHARAEGTPDPEIARAVFGIDPDADPLRARTMVETHYQRALWLAGPGGRHIVE